MITTKDILNFTETFAPLETQMDFDNSGLLVGDENTAVTKVIVALDITDSVIEEAVKEKAQLIISHHPVIFTPLKKIERNSIVYKLIENNIDALCLHTNLDLSSDFGVNTCLADAVGVKNYAFVPGECLLIGELEKETKTKNFAETVKKALNCNGVRFTKGNKKIKKVAICSGSGGNFVFTAVGKADVLLTGEIKHNEILSSDRLSLAIVDAGHYRTEDIVIAPLCNKLRKQFPEVEFIKSETFTDDIEFI